MEISLNHPAKKTKKKNPNSSKKFGSFSYKRKKTRKDETKCYPNAVLNPVEKQHIHCIPTDMLVQP